VHGSAVIGDHKLDRTADLLNHHRPLTIVAIGSSSTQGYGASAPRQAYPAQLAALLKVRFPQSMIRVVNKGIGGDDNVGMVARFARDVYPQRPDLVIWQTGTNDAIRQMPIERFSQSLARGLKDLKAHGLDVVLMTPQYAPDFIRAKHYESYLAVMQSKAEEHHVALFERFHLSEAWFFDPRFADAPPVTADGLHQADAGYHCDALLLAEYLVSAVSPTTAARLP
jgi:lysophospholipase L1-like esterase